MIMTMLPFSTGRNRTNTFNINTWAITILSLISPFLGPSG